MYSYIRGIVTEIESSHITIEKNGMGYLIHTANPYLFKLNDEAIVYLYQNIKEDDNSLYGFISQDEKQMFLKLINVKGIGPKMALPMLATGNISGLIDAIERENIIYLTKFPKVGEKVARQIILDLKGKLATGNNVISSESNTELTEVLLSLGYKQADIKKVLPQVNHSLSLEEQIKQALMCLLK